MYKITIHITREFDSIEIAKAFYNKVVTQIRSYKDIHINGQIITKLTGYSPDNPDGHEVKP